MTDRTGIAPRGYELVLPPEWARIPMRSGTREAVRAIVDDAFSRLPADTPPDRVGPYRRELERRLNDAVEEARRAEALDLYLPLERMHGIAVAASIVVSEMNFPDEVAVDPSAVAHRLLEAPGRAGRTSAVEVDEVPGVRTERTAKAGQDGSELASRRVDYVVPVPDDPGRWVSVVFSTVGAGQPDDELADLFVELFDAMMSTFRWSRS
ncbi:hypothetical protein [Streptomyces tsukubensis]|uniref:hypothetical protein n=1 Tax=Streptomyces tsukubensis TaxID=83656 RepID=UPI00098EAD3A|nr:hypothetical protein [Streptomyces tsukubensis]QFR94972.1 hypothetical protein GBW32_20545 [Streptomyces tsukubensis]